MRELELAYELGMRMIRKKDCYSFLDIVIDDLKKEFEEIKDEREWEILEESIISELLDVDDLTTIDLLDLYEKYFKGYGHVEIRITFPGESFTKIIRVNGERYKAVIRCEMGLRHK